MTSTLSRSGYRQGHRRPRKEEKMRTFKIGRSAITGRFKSVKVAQQQKNTSVVETIKVPTRKTKPRR